MYKHSGFRFLNLCGATNERQGTFYRTAKKNNIPDWLIDMRHELAHDHTMPSRFMLEKGLRLCFDWVRTEYWEHEIGEEGKQSDEDGSEEIRRLFHLYCELIAIRFVHGDIALDDLEATNKGVHRKVNREYKNVPFNRIKDVEKVLSVKIKRYVLRNRDETLASEFAEILTTFASALPETQLTGDSIVIWNPTFKLFAQSKLLGPLIKALLDNGDSPAASDWLTQIFRSLTEGASGSINFNLEKCEGVIKELRDLHADVISCGKTAFLDDYLNLCGYSDDYKACIREHFKELNKRLHESQDEPLAFCDFQVPGSPKETVAMEVNYAQPILARTNGKRWALVQGKLQLVASKRFHFACFRYVDVSRMSVRRVAASVTRC